MANKPFLSPDSKAANVLAVLLALGIWELAACALRNRLLLAGPRQVLLHLWKLLPLPAFRQAVWFTFSRITLGFLLAFLLALLLAAVSARSAWARTLLRPWLLVIRTVPVASFIVLALLWLSGKRLSIFISFLMVLPVLYANMLQGFQAADPSLLEMAAVFRVPLRKRIRSIYVPALHPYLLAGCRSALGLCWKAGVAAEVIGVCSGSVGGRIYDAKVYLDIPDLFAWTLVVVAVSAAFEQFFLLLLKAGLHLLEGRPWS